MNTPSLIVRIGNVHYPGGARITSVGGSKIAITGVIVVGC